MDKDFIFKFLSLDWLWCFYSVINLLMEVEAASFCLNNKFYWPGKYLVNN